VNALGRHVRVEEVHAVFLAVDSPAHWRTPTVLRSVVSHSPPLLDHPVSGRVASSAGGMKNWENFQNMLIQGGMKFLADFVGSFQKSESPSPVTQI
jgi:hypothetical protein